MSLSGAIIKLHDFSIPMRKRLESRKSCIPYMWGVSDAKKRSEGRGFYFNEREEVATGFNLRCQIAEPTRRAEYYSDPDGSFKVWPYVFRLPGRRGFLAGCGEGAGMWGSMSTTIHDDIEEASRAAHEEARDAAESMITANESDRFHQDAE